MTLTVKGPVLALTIAGLFGGACSRKTEGKGASGDMAATATTVKGM